MDFEELKGGGKKDRGGKGRHDDIDTQISKTLSYLLRHGAIKEGLNMGADGYVLVAELLEQRADLKKFKVDEAKIRQIVSKDLKGRYELKEDGKKLYIRATQGHSIKEVKEDELMNKITDAATVPLAVHGSYYSFWDSIKAGGLKTFSRNHVHFATGYPEDDGVKSGMRKNTNLFIELDVAKAMVDGLVFYRSANNVILTAGIDKTVPSKYFKNVYWNDTLIFKDGADIQMTEEAKSATINKHDFEYLLVLDFEANCIDGGQLECQEIIEFPIIAIDMVKGEITTKVFHQYVKPEVVPKLTPFCTELTGITQEVVDKGIPLKETLKAVDDFLTKEGIFNGRFTFVTCGDWDLRTCLRHEAIYKKLDVAPYLKRWINIKELYSEAINGGKKPGGLHVMIETLGMKFDGRPHSGIDDSKNIARIVVEMIKRGVIFQKKDVHSTAYVTSNPLSIVGGDETKPAGAEKPGAEQKIPEAIAKRIVQPKAAPPKP